MGRYHRLVIRTLFSVTLLTGAFGIGPSEAEDVPRAVFAEKFGYAS